MAIASITPHQFVEKWRGSKLTERSASHQHFIDLCRLLSEPTPAESDPEGMTYTFEKGANTTAGGRGWADVWKRGCFGWEYKGKRKNLTDALVQLQRYAFALENPPLLIVSDMDTIAIYTNFTNTVQQTHIIHLDELSQPENLQKLKWAFTDPEQLRPGVTRAAVTQAVAQKFTELAGRLRARGFEPQQVAHFINRLLFCMFAEDIGILPRSLFSRLLETAVRDPTTFERMCRHLFRAMQHGGTFGVDAIDWFNGGLFDNDQALPLERDDLKLALEAARLDWSEIEPSIFGTLFERGLDPDTRSQLGAHYTDADSIMRIVNPVVLAPLRREWADARASIEEIMSRRDKVKTKATAAKLYNEARQQYETFRRRLAGVRVLDPACGSGNFLYLALQGLKDLENEVIFEAEHRGLPQAFPEIGPQNVLGIELNAYAAELARVTIWIGHIQWMLKHNFGLKRDPILQNLDQIACRDALLNEDGSETEWPRAECIVGNPPFLGDKRMIGELGEEYVAALRSAYLGRVPGGADLVTYWFEKARGQIVSGRTGRAGLVATNSIRDGKNRKVLDAIATNCMIFNAWGNEPWILNGASVRVSLVCFAEQGIPHLGPPHLDGQEVTRIYTNLDAQIGEVECDVTKAKVLQENEGVTFIGTQKTGPFDIPGDVAREWLRLPTNPNGKHNREVLRPWVNADGLTRNRPWDTWIIDFGVNMSEAEAALFEAPFKHVVEQVKPKRAGNRDLHLVDRYWLFERPRPELRQALAPLQRYIVTPRVGRYRIFVWLPVAVFPDTRLVVIAREDDMTLGILQSRFHREWVLKTCSDHGAGDDPTYNADSVFKTFAFPPGLTPDVPLEALHESEHAIRISNAARHLVTLRDNWLNPPEIVRREPEILPGYPDRLLPVNLQATKELKKRTLTNLYQQMPSWLSHVHSALDEAVAAGYGWPADISGEEAVRRLLQLNMERAAAQ